MGRCIELAKTVKGFLQYSFFPVYLLNDISQQDSPKRKIVLDNGVNEEIMGSNLAVVSWNILRNYNKGEIRKTLLKTIKERNPQVILVQEAPVYEGYAFWEDDLFSGFNVYYAPLHQVKSQTQFYNFVHSGQLTLSRISFTKTEMYQLPSVAGQFLGDKHIIKRVVAYTQVQTNARKKLGIYNVHLENATWQTGRKKQIEYLLEIIEKNNDDIILVGGDFNTFLGRLEGGIHRLERAGFSKLFSGWGVIPRLDHMFVRGNKATGLELQGSGSDHQPIMALIRI